MEVEHAGKPIKIIESFPGHERIPQSVRIYAFTKHQRERERKGGKENKIVYFNVISLPPQKNSR